MLLLEPEYRNLFLYCYKSLNYNVDLYPLVITDFNEYYIYDRRKDGEYITFLWYDPLLDYDNKIKVINDEFAKIGRHRIEFYTTTSLIGYYSIIYYKRVVIIAMSYQYRYTSQYIYLYIFVRLVYSASVETINGPLSFSVSGYAYLSILLTKYVDTQTFQTDYKSSGQFLSYVFNDKSELCYLKSYSGSGSKYVNDKTKYLLISLFPNSDDFNYGYVSSEIEIVLEVCDLINSFGNFIYGIIQPLFPNYYHNISEIMEEIEFYASRSDVLAFTGLLSYIINIYISIEKMRLY